MNGGLFFAKKMFLYSLVFIHNTVLIRKKIFEKNRNNVLMILENEINILHDIQFPF